MSTLTAVIKLTRQNIDDYNACIELNTSRLNITKDRNEYALIESTIDAQKEAVLNLAEILTALEKFKSAFIGVF